jgi:hypothetical protein
MHQIGARSDSGTEGGSMHISFVTTKGILCSTVATGGGGGGTTGVTGGGGGGTAAGERREGGGAGGGEPPGLPDGAEIFWFILM